jgi:hypothetical protein
MTSCIEESDGGMPGAVPDATEIQHGPIVTNTTEPIATAMPTLPPATGTPPPTLTPTMTLCPMEVTAQHPRHRPPFHQVLSYMI